MTTESDESPLIDEGNSGGSSGLKKGPWTSAEDAILVDYVRKHGEGNWNAVQKHSGLSRCGKSCRLRWANHLRPNLKKGAFTPDEERLIIELHAKMGNKWARMAAHLPGRTDNEIKNYWNTRIKRHQRAGLPLYPPELCLQQMQEIQLSQNTNSDGGQNGHFQPSSIPEVIFDSLKESQGVLPYNISEIPGLSTSTMLMNSPNPSEYYSYIPPIVHPPKCPRETATSLFGYIDAVRNHPPQFEQPPVETFGSSFTYENQFSYINGNFSASKPSSRASKLELPSLQYAETDFASWRPSSPPVVCESVDAFIQSPPRSGALHSDHPSPKNSGLLDALLHEAKSKSSKSRKLSHNSQNCLALAPDDEANCSVLDMSEAKWEEYGDAVSPLGNSAALIFKDCTPLTGSSSSLEENPPQILLGSKIKTEAGEKAWPVNEENKENRAKLDYSRPDALLGSCWFGRTSAFKKDQGPKSDFVSAPIHDDLGSGSEPNQGWGFGSCQWNNMPPVCQISELP